MDLVAHAHVESATPMDIYNWEVTIVNKNNSIKEIYYFGDNGNTIRIPVS